MTPDWEYPADWQYPVHAWDPELGRIVGPDFRFKQPALDEQFDSLGGAERGPGRPKSYHLADGTRVPSVTTITARFKESTGLLNWANQQGREGKTMDEARQGATDVGSIVHRLVEARIHGEKAAKIPAEFRERVLSAFSAWEQWMSNSRFQTVATEQPLVSEEWRYGGTLDCVARDVQGRLCLLDWKSSNAVWPEMLQQLGAYALLWNETKQEQLTGGFHLARFSKHEGDFEHRFFPQLDDAQRMFLLLREAYGLDVEVKRRAR